MNITVNQQQQCLSRSHTLAELLVSLNIASQGVAVAVNGQVINRSRWSDHQLADNDQVSVFEAIAGG